MADPATPATPASTSWKDWSKKNWWPITVGLLLAITLMVIGQGIASIFSTKPPTKDEVKTLVNATTEKSLSGVNAKIDGLSTQVKTLVDGLPSMRQDILAKASDSCSKQCVAPPEPKKTVIYKPRPAPKPQPVPTQQVVVAKNFPCEMYFNGNLVDKTMTEDRKSCRVWTDAQAAKNGWVFRKVHH